MSLSKAKELIFSIIREESGLIPIYLPAERLKNSTDGITANLKIMPVSTHSGWNGRKVKGKMLFTIRFNRLDGEIQPTIEAENILSLFHFNFERDGLLISDHGEIGGSFDDKNGRYYMPLIIDFEYRSACFE